MKYILYAIVGFVAISVFLTMCGGPGNRNVSWKSKMTVVMEIDGERYEGSSTIKVMPYDESSYGQDYGLSVQGEAVTIDLGEHGYAFALWNRIPESLKVGDINNFYMHPVRKYRKKYDQFENKPSRPKQNFDTWVAYKRSGDRTEIPPDQFPQLVRFGDVSDSETVDVLESAEEIESVYGEGARMVSVTVEVARGRVTKKRIQTLMPWICERMNIHGNNTSHIDATVPAEGRLSRGTFILNREGCWG